MSIKIKVKGRFETRKSMLEEFQAEIDSQLKSEKVALVQELADKTPVDTGEARDGWVTTPTGINNPVEHITKLNSGTSKQAPSYFVEETLLEHEGVRPSGIIVRNT